MDSTITLKGHGADAFSFDTPLWDRFYLKSKQEIKDSRYYRNVRKRKLL